MAEIPLGGALIQKPGHQSQKRRRSCSIRRTRVHRIKRHDSVLADGNFPPDLSERRGRSRSRTRSSQHDLEWATRASRESLESLELPRSLPIYDPKPLLHREDAFKIIEENRLTEMIAAETAPSPGLETDYSTEYDSDELEFGTTQFPEWESCIYDFRP